jgi:hypothetical protein
MNFRSITGLDRCHPDTNADQKEHAMTATVPCTSTRNRRRPINAALAGLAVAALLLCASPAASASAEWKLTTTPNPSETYTSRLNGTSCTPATTECTAVGTYKLEFGGSLPLAERWNGKEWKLQTVPNPSGSEETTLRKVSCPTTTSCEAVGYYRKSSVNRAFAAVWNGTEWKLQTTPEPVGALSAQLEDVSCTAAGACTAVGYYKNSSGTMLSLAERWNGTEWKIQTTPNPTGAKKTEAAGVSCATVESCVMVGRYENSSSKWVPFSETWNVTEWTVQAVSNPSGSVRTFAFGVSCTSASACTMVGSFVNSSEVETGYAERWNGSTWTLQTVAKPSGTTGYGLFGVSCVSATECTTSGTKVTTEVVYMPLAERWNGTTWTVESTPNGGGGQGFLAGGVSCASASFCAAVGSDGLSKSLAEIYTSTPEWKLTSTANPAETVNSRLNGTSCMPATTECTAVGSYNLEFGSSLPLAERWNGKEWKLQTVPNPSGSEETRLSKVSCPTTTSCEAVGYYRKSGVYRALAAVWNGTEWKLQTTPEPVGALSAQLEDVSCTAAGACTAVGNYKNSSGTTLSLAERWNGTEWKIQTTPNPTGAKKTEAAGVSCATAESCVMVGRYENSSSKWVPFSETWNGIEWTVQAVSNPSGSVRTFAFGVSCTSASACTMVGSFVNSSEVETGYAERWNGSTWTLQTVAKPSGAQSYGFFGVSCVSATECTTSGTKMTPEIVYMPLVERWNGTAWTVESTPNGGGGQGFLSGGVSCTSASFCAAVGADGLSKPLAEIYS